MPIVYRKTNKLGKPVGKWRGRYKLKNGERQFCILTDDETQSQRLFDDIVHKAEELDRASTYGIITKRDAVQIASLNVTMGEVIDGYIGSMDATPRSKAQERGRLNRIVSEKECNIGTIHDLIDSAPKFQKFLRGLVRSNGKKGSAPTTIKRYRMAYGCLCAWCCEVDHEYLTPETNPATTVKMPKCPAEDDRLPHRALSVAEMVRLCAPDTSTHDSLGRRYTEAMVRGRAERILRYRLGVMTGYRSEEIQRLQVEDFKFADCSLTLPKMKSKTKLCTVTVPLTAGLCKALAEWFRGWAPKRYCWKHGINPAAFKRDLGRAKIKAVADGINVNVRSFRKSHNAWMMDADVLLETRLLLRRTVGTSAEKLATHNYADDPQRWRLMADGIVRLEEWLIEQGGVSIA